MRPGLGSPGCGLEGGDLPPQINASMRPGLGSPGCRRMVAAADGRRLGFNEAGAWEPRMPWRRLAFRQFCPGFNEAGAWEPRMRMRAGSRLAVALGFNEAGAWEPRMPPVYRTLTVRASSRRFASGPVFLMPWTPHWPPLRPGQTSKTPMESAGSVVSSDSRLPHTASTLDFPRQDEHTCLLHKN